MNNEFLSKYKIEKSDPIRKISVNSSESTDKNKGISHSIFIHGRSRCDKSFIYKTIFIHQFIKKDLFNTSFAVASYISKSPWYSYRYDILKIKRSSDHLKELYRFDYNCKMRLKSQFLVDKYYNIFTIAKRIGSLSKYKYE